MRNTLLFLIVLTSQLHAVTTINTIYSTFDQSTLDQVTPNFVSQNEDATSYSYNIDNGSGSVATGNIMGMEASLYFDGSANFSDNENLNALSVLDSNSFYFSTRTPAAIAGFGTEADDVILYNSLTNIASTFWEGDNFSTSGDFNIDALHVFENGTILMSTTDSETIYGTDLRNGDIALIDPGAGTAAVFFSENFFAGDADIAGLSIERNSGDLLISSSFAESINGTSFGNEDIVRVTSTDGFVLATNVTAEVVFDGSQHLLNGGNINAIGSFEIIPEPSVSLLFSLSGMSALFLRRRI